MCSPILFTIHFRAYLGMTVHWIENDLSRGMSVLLLKRMQFEITNKELAESIDTILKFYEITDKTVLCTTDNGSNFLKAFR